MKAPLREWLRSAWEYGSEIVFSILLGIILLLILRIEWFRSVLYENRSDLFVLLLTLSGVCAAIWVAFLAVLNSEFGKELRLHGQSSVYSRALAFPMFLAILASLVAPLRNQNASHARTAIALFSLIYAAVAFFNLVRNVSKLVNLWQEWEQHAASRR